MAFDPVTFDAVEALRNAQPRIATGYIPELGLNLNEAPWVHFPLDLFTEIPHITIINYRDGVPARVVELNTTGFRAIRASGLSAPGEATWIAIQGR